MGSGVPFYAVSPYLSRRIRWTTGRIDCVDPHRFDRDVGAIGPPTVASRPGRSAEKFDVDVVWSFIVLGLRSVVVTIQVARCVGAARVGRRCLDNYSCPFRSLAMNSSNSSTSFGAVT